MNDSTFGGDIWAIVVIGGFIVLGLAILVAKLRNRTSPEQKARTEQATRDLYREESRRDADGR